MVEVMLKDYSDCAICESATFRSNEGFPEITYRFVGGKAYGLCSDYGCGAWALATALGGRGKQPCGSVTYNGRVANCNVLRRHACFVGEKIYPGINSTFFSKNAEECIKKALRISKSEESWENITHKFHLSPERLRRNLSYIYNHEIWYISIAVGFAEGKDVFCFPWLNSPDFKCFEIMSELGVVDILKNAGKILLVPSNHVDRLQQSCDELICFD